MTFIYHILCINAFSFFGCCKWSKCKMKQYEENKMIARFVGDAFVKIKSEWILFYILIKLNRFCSTINCFISLFFFLLLFLLRLLSSFFSNEIIIRKDKQVTFFLQNRKENIRNQATFAYEQIFFLFQSKWPLLILTDS